MPEGGEEVCSPHPLLHPLPPRQLLTIAQSQQDGSRGLLRLILEVPCHGLNVALQSRGVDPGYTPLWATSYVDTLTGLVHGDEDVMGQGVLEHAMDLVLTFQVYG